MCDTCIPIGFEGGVINRTEFRFGALALEQQNSGGGVVLHGVAVRSLQITIVGFFFFGGSRLRFQVRATGAGAQRRGRSARAATPCCGATMLVRQVPRIESRWA